MITKSVREDETLIAMKSMNQLSASINPRNQRDWQQCTLCLCKYLSSSDLYAISYSYSENLSPCSSALMCSQWCKDLWLLVDVVSDLVLQVYLGPTGEKQLYHVSMTTVASKHEGSLAILRGQNILQHSLANYLWILHVILVQWAPTLEWNLHGQ